MKKKDMMKMLNSMSSSNNSLLYGDDGTLHELVKDGVVVYQSETYKLICEKERLIVELSDEINILKHQIEELQKELIPSL